MLLRLNCVWSVVVHLRKLIVNRQLTAKCCHCNNNRYLHVEKHIVHRDLKPANMFVRRDPARDGRPALVVGDVGLAKEMQNTIAKASAAGTPM